MLEKTSPLATGEPALSIFTLGLHSTIWSNYLSLRLLFYCEPLATVQTTIPLMIEIVEKSLKLFVAIKNNSTKPVQDSMIFQHDIETLRQEAAKFDNLFNDSEIVDFTKDLDDRQGVLFQKMRYGLEKSNSGIKADAGKMLSAVDKIVLKSVMLLPNHYQRLFLCTSLKPLIEVERSQIKNRKDLLVILRNGNDHFDDYVKNYESLQRHFEEDLQKLGI